jgi:hypothetical protein
LSSPQAAQQIKQVLAARGAASGSNVGIGVVAMSSFEDATAWLKVRTGFVLPFHTDWVLLHDRVAVLNGDHERRQDPEAHERTNCLHSIDVTEPALSWVARSLPRLCH